MSLNSFCNLACTSTRSSLLKVESEKQHAQLSVFSLEFQQTSHPYGISMTLGIYVLPIFGPYRTVDISSNGINQHCWVTPSLGQRCRRHQILVEYDSALSQSTVGTKRLLVIANGETIY